MKLTLNGQERQTDADTVARIVEQLHLAGPAAVEVNGQVIPRKNHPQTPLNDGDVVEIVTLVGGG